MNTHPRFFIAICSLLALFLSSCSSDFPTHSLTVQYGKISVTSEKSEGKPTIAANINVRLINRTERGMNVAFLEGTIFDANTNKAIARFRPIIPEAYGSTSTAVLLPKETKDIPVVTPIGLDTFDFSNSTSVTIKLAFQTTDGYRTEVVSAPTPITRK